MLDRMEAKEPARVNIANPDQSKIDQFAGYLVHGIGPLDAGAAVGFSILRVQELLNSEEFKELLAKKKSSVLDSYMNTSKNLDRIEQLATGILAKTLEIDQDKDFALRAYAVVSRSPRRATVHKPETIEPGKQSAPMVLSLNVNFIRAVQDKTIDMTPVKLNASHSEYNVATPDTLARLLDAVHLRPDQVQMPGAEERKNHRHGHGLSGLAPTMEIGEAEALDGRPRKYSDDGSLVEDRIKLNPFGPID